MLLSQFVVLFSYRLPLFDHFQDLLVHRFRPIAFKLSDLIFRREVKHGIAVTDEERKDCGNNTEFNNHFLVLRLFDRDIHFRCWLQFRFRLRLQKSEDKLEDGVRLHLRNECQRFRKEEES